MNRLLMLAGVALLSACTAAQVATTLQDGQLVCQVGSAYQAMRATSGQAVLAKGATATAVQDACALVKGTAVALPVGATAGSATVTLPATLTIPLGT